MVTGAAALAEYAHVVAEKYPVNIALHTDHCPKDKLDGFMRPLIKISQERVARGEEPLFQSHMWDGSAVPLDENLASPRSCSKSAPRREIIMEMEIGVVGGEEDGVVARSTRSCTRRPRTRSRPPRPLGVGEKGRYLLAATFGNVHGVYKPG